jgi:hypothetical protein
VFSPRWEEHLETACQYACLTKTRIEVERRVNEAGLLLLIRFVVGMCGTKYEMWCL